MNFLKKFHQIAANNAKYLSGTVVTSSHIKHIQTKTPAEEDVIANIRDKLCCTDDIAKNIYTKFPSLQIPLAIKNDTLEFLRSKIAEQSVIENPSLVTMDRGSLKDKINLLMELEPKCLDDFVPLLTLDEKEFKTLVKLLAKDNYEDKQNNRIYYLSEKLKVEPKEILKYRVDFGHEIFISSFESFKKKLNILLDYGVSPSNVRKSLYILRYTDEIFVRRSEQILAAGLPIKVTYFQLTEQDFDEKIRLNRKKRDKQKTAISVKVAEKLKKRNLEKSTIVDTLNSLLGCSDWESSEIYYNHVNEISELPQAKRNIKYLSSIGFSLEIITKNGFLLAMPMTNIEEKIKIIKQMEPSHIEHFIPLMRVEAADLENYKCRIVENNAIGSAHPIYYFSTKLDTPAVEVAKRFAECKNIFLRYDSFKLKSTLDLLLQLDVEPSSILNCTSVFRYSHAIIKGSVCNIKSSGNVNKILSWMIIGFQSSKHDKLLTAHMMEKKSLEGFENNMKYLAHRLNLSDSEVSLAISKYPVLRKCSAQKLKNHLDYLLNETDITAADIVAFPFIFGKSLDTIKSRLAEMTEIGAPISLSALFQNKKIYREIIQAYLPQSDGQ